MATTDISSTQVSTTSESVSSQTVTAQFSNWNSYLSDVRKRYWDAKTGSWYWKIEDVTDADTPNINQLDISIQANERVEIRVSAISEVGWPDSILESDWSNILTVDFPDDINDVTNENDFILQEASQDQTLVQMDSTLNTKGIYQHIDDQFYLNNILFKHMDKNIGTSFKSDQSNTLNLFEYLTTLTDRIQKLEETINQVKGNLKIYLYKNDVLLKEILNNTSTNLKVELEDYLVSVTGSTRTYVNSLYMIDDYSVSLSNIAQTGNLGLLSDRLYVSGGTNIFFSDIMNQALLVDYNDDLYVQQSNQFIWFFDKDIQDNIYSGSTPDNTYWILNSDKYNIGASGITNLYQPWNNINSVFTADGVSGTKLMATVHPYFPDVTNLVENGQEKIRNINPQSNFVIKMKIFFKWFGERPSGEIIPVQYVGGHMEKTRKVKFYFETGGLTYQFAITFSLSNFRQYFSGTSNKNIITTA